ncbi:MAG: hypothetical protein IT426_15780, partial [Pirellulales bacterium]|nr:hypothetical protein [Pirellulales bacterium]
RAKNIDDETILVYAGTASLSGKGAGGSLPVTPAAAAFAAGVWTGNVTVSAVDAGVALTADDGAGVSAASNAFDVAAGPLDHFQWSTIASPQYKDLPFSTTLTAVDAHGFTVTDFNGTVGLSGWVGTGTSFSIVITECNEDTPDYVEIQNVSGSNANTAGWLVALNNAENSNINAVHDVVWNLPNSMNAGQILYRTDDTADNYWGSNIWWGSATKKGWAMIVDDLGNVVDFAVWGYTNTEIASLNVTVGGHSISIGTQWIGAGVSFGGSSTLSLQRKGNSDNNAGSDMAWIARSKGTQNAGLTVPFPGSAAPISITPTTASFASGVWTGNVSILDTATDMHLQADDGAGHSADSNPFNVFANLPTPTVPDLLPESDSGMNEADNLTNRNNSDSSKTLKFAVGSCLAGATVVVYADGAAIGQTVAGGSDVIVVTNASASLGLLDGEHAIVARQFMAGVATSNDSASLKITVDTQSPTIQAWLSAAAHAGAGEASLLIPDDGAFSEPRDAGIGRFLLNFSEAVDPTTFPTSSLNLSGLDVMDAGVDLSGVSVAASLRHGDTQGAFSLTPALPDYARYWARVSGVKDLAGNALSGDGDRVLTALRGDVNGDRMVNVTDLSYIKGSYVNPIDTHDPMSIRADVDGNGLVDLSDVNAAWTQRNHNARFISDPSLPGIPSASRTLTWDGGGPDGKWSTAENWLGDAAPASGDNLVFPTDAAQPVNVNDYPSDALFGTITVFGGNYRIQNNPLRSKALEVLGDGALTAVSMVCETLAIGSVSQSAAGAVALNSAPLIADETQPSVAAEAASPAETAMPVAIAFADTALVEPSPVREAGANGGLAFSAACVAPAATTPSSAVPAGPVFPHAVLSPQSEKAAASSIEAGNGTSPATTPSREAKNRALLAFMEEYQNRLPFEREDLNLLLHKPLVKKDVLAKQAFDDFHLLWLGRD